MTSGVKRLVHGSTIGVFRAMPGQAVGEDSPLEPQNIYGITKLEGEKVIRQKRGRFPVAVVRISETYGPGDRRLLKLFRSIRKKRGILIGSGANLHHPIYIDDLVSALRSSATAGGAVERPFVAAGGSTVSTREMMEAIARELGTNAPAIHVPFAPVWHLAALTEDLLRPLKIQPPLHRRRMNFFTLGFSFSGEGARQAIGFAPRVGFAEGIKRTADWYRAQGLL
jgi:nucleoside-diphosphate-sugar epimerase